MKLLPEKKNSKGPRLLWPSSNTFLSYFSLNFKSLFECGDSVNDQISFYTFHVTLLSTDQVISKKTSHQRVTKKNQLPCMLFLAFLGLLLQLFICLIISRFVIRMHTMVFVNREAADIRALNAHAHLSAVVCEHTDKKWPTLPKKQKENKLLNYRRFSIGSTSVHL